MRGGAVRRGWISGVGGFFILYCNHATMTVSVTMAAPVLVMSVISLMTTRVNLGVGVECQVTS